MKQQDETNIRLLVKSEEDLYTPFSPDDEFSEPVKTYIQSKAQNVDYRHQVKLTVISSRPLDEDRFRTAAANWARDEKVMFAREDKHATIKYRAMFIIGAAIIVLVTLLKQYLEPLAFTLILILGTAVLGRGVSNWYVQVPTIKARKQLTAEMEKKSTIVFEYRDDNDIPTARS